MYDGLQMMVKNQMNSCFGKYIQKVHASQEYLISKNKSSLKFFDNSLINKKVLKTDLIG